MNKRFVAAEYY